MAQRSKVQLVFTLGVLAGCLALLGCLKRPEVIQAAPAAVGPAAAPVPAPSPPETPVARPAPPPEAPPRPPAAGVPASAPLKDAFFDFDKDKIRNDQKAALDANVAWLKANPRAKITIEGYCDERGTSEYNLALGERRAKAVKDYLVAAGIPADRIAVISYGKERPFVLGYDESAWKWNRRGRFVVTGQ